MLWVYFCFISRLDPRQKPWRFTHPKIPTRLKHCNELTARLGDTSDRCRFLNLIQIKQQNNGTPTTREIFWKVLWNSQYCAYRLRSLEKLFLSLATPFRCGTQAPNEKVFKHWGWVTTTTSWPYKPCGLPFQHVVPGGNYKRAHITSLPVIISCVEPEMIVKLLSISLKCVLILFQLECARWWKRLISGFLPGVKIRIPIATQHNQDQGLLKVRSYNIKTATFKMTNWIVKSKSQHNRSLSNKIKFDNPKKCRYNNIRFEEHLQLKRSFAIGVYA